MTIRPLTPAALAAALAPLALAGALLAPAAQAAQVAPPPPVGASRGFHIYNLSSHRLKLTSVDGDLNFEGRPAIGEVLSPGVGYHDWEVQIRFLTDQNDTAHYAILDDTGQTIGTYNAHLEAKGAALPHLSSDCSISLGQCTAGGDTPTTLTVLDPPGTTIEFGPGQGQAQAATLKQYCDNANSAACTFAATKEDKLSGKETQIGDAVYNYTDEEDETKISCTDTVEQSNSVGVAVSAGAKLFKVVEAEVKVTYDHEWITSNEFSQDVLAKIAPHHYVWMTLAPPLYRDTGDFTLTLGNTTWKLPGVYFDTPDPNGHANWSIHDAPITAQARAAGPGACNGATLHAGLGPRPPAAADDAVTLHHDARVGSYRQRQAIRHAQRGQLDEAVFNEGLNAGKRLEAALAAAGRRQP
jgi:hypothetical protein